MDRLPFLTEWLNVCYFNSVIWFVCVLISLCMFLCTYTVMKWIISLYFNTKKLTLVMSSFSSLQYTAWNYVVNTFATCSHYYSQNASDHVMSPHVFNFLVTFPRWIQGMRGVTVTLTRGKRNKGNWSTRTKKESIGEIRQRGTYNKNKQQQHKTSFLKTIEKQTKMSRKEMNCYSGSQQ